MLNWLWSRLTGYAIAVGAALAILFAAYSRGKADAAARQAEGRLSEIKKAREVEHEVDRLGAGDIDQQLGRWLRD